MSINLGEVAVLNMLLNATMTDKDTRIAQHSGRRGFDAVRFVVTPGEKMRYQCRLNEAMNV